MKNWCKIIELEDHDVLVYKVTEPETDLGIRIDDTRMAYPTFESKEARDATFDLIWSDDESPELRKWFMENITLLENNGAH